MTTPKNGKDRSASHRRSRDGGGRERVLADHRREGKRLIPPMLQLPGELCEVSWLEHMLPELLWIGILEAKYGQADAADLSLGLAKLTAVATKEPRWYGTTSSFGGISHDDWQAIRGGLGATGKLGRLRAGLGILVQHYPSCPLQALFEPQTSNLNSSSGGESLDQLSAIVASMVDRSSVRAMFVQGCLVYFGFCLDRLVVREGLPLASFPELQHYPQTELSQTVASSVRAVVNQCAAQEGFVGREWPRYFWNRGLELTSCRGVE